MRKVQYVRLSGMYEEMEENFEKECTRTGWKECKICWKNKKWKECMSVERNVRGVRGTMRKE
jgi:hypothetical protein